MYIYIYIHDTVVWKSVSAHIEVSHSVLPTSSIALWQNSFVINRIYIYIHIYIYIYMCGGAGSSVGIATD